MNQNIDIGAVGNSLAEDSDSSSSTTSGSSGDSSSNRTALPAVKAMGTAFIAFDEITGVRYHDDLMDEDGEMKDETDGDVSVVLQNPTVVNGSIFKNQLHETHDVEVAQDVDHVRNGGDRKPGQYLDYRVANTDDPEFERSWTKDGDLKDIGGMNVDGFESFAVDDFDEDAIRVYMSGLAGRKVIQALDANGGRGARMVGPDEDSNDLSDEKWANSRGLIEFHPDHNDYDVETPNPRFARFPQLREDFEGESGMLVVARRSDFYPDYNGNLTYLGYVLDTDDPSEAEANFEDHTLGMNYLTCAEAAQADLYAPRLYWEGNQAPDNAETVGYDVNVSSDSDDTDDPDGEGGATTVDDEGGNPENLSAEGREFAEGVVKNVQNDNGDSIDDVWSDFGQLIEKNRDKGNITSDVDESDVRAYVNARL